MPCSPVTLADSTSVKSSGAAVMFGHSIPISSSRIGSQLGHLNDAPSAAPTLRKTPKPGRVLNSPRPLNAKLRASPPMIRPPARTSAPTETNETRSFSVPIAPVSSMKSTAVIVSTEPSVIFIVSALNLNAENWPTLEHHGRAHGLRVGHARLTRLERQAVRERRGDRLAGQEARAAGGEVERRR